MNKFVIETHQVSCPVRKSRFVEPFTGNRINQFTPDDKVGENYEGPRLNDGNENSAVMVFEGDRPQDARVTTFGDSKPNDIQKRCFDRVKISARNEDFQSNRPIFLRVRRRGVVIFCQKLNLADFNVEEGFKSHQIKLGMTIEDDGQNYDIDLEQDKTRAFVKAGVDIVELSGSRSAEFLSPTPEGEDPDVEFFVRGTEKQESTGRFVLAEIKLQGEAKFATEVRHDEQSGVVENLQDEPFNLSPGHKLRGTLPVPDRSLDRWFEINGKPGHFVLKTALIPNIDPFAPDGVVKVNN